MLAQISGASKLFIQDDIAQLKYDGQDRSGAIRF
jgi:hypothetical protein